MSRSIKVEWEEFGKYRLVRKIADGGMASIFLASSVGPGGFEKPCVIKRIRPEFSATPSFREMLVREAKVAALLAHPNIVQIFDFGEVDGEYFLTMEWVEGAPLHRIIAAESRAKRKITVAVALEIALEVARALEYLGRGVQVHGQATQLVHRDVSPSNILISTSGSVKLTDFGIVKVLEAPAGTEAGVVKGKYAYMSPEQLQGLALDPRSDLFSLGVVLYETLTQKRLFRRRDIASTIAAVLGARVPPASQLNPEVSPALDAVLRRMLAKRRDNRYGHAADLIADLEHVIAQLPPSGQIRPRLASLAYGTSGRAKERPDDTVSTTPLPVDDTSLLGNVPLESGHSIISISSTDEAAFETETMESDATVWWAAAAVLVAIITSIGFWLLVLD